MRGDEKNFIRMTPSVPKTSKKPVYDEVRKGMGVQKEPYINMNIAELKKNLQVLIVSKNTRPNKMSAHCNCFKAERKTTRLEAQVIGNGLSYGLEDPYARSYTSLGVGRNEDKKHITQSLRLQDNRSQRCG